MKLAQPQNLYALLALVPMLAAFVGYWWWKQRTKRKLGEHALVSAMAAQLSARRQIIRGVLVLMSVALLAVALAQPQWGQTNRPIKRTGVDIVFALDLSHSMMAQDASPNRLEAAKNEIETTLEMLRGDRVGLVVFTSISFAQSPLTTDYGAIRFYLEKLDPDQMPVGGTSVGRAITDGLELLTGRASSGEEQATEMKRAKNQLIVLITDGEDHESDPLAAAEMARAHGVHVVTVGFGSKAGARIPLIDERGNVLGFKRDRDGKVVRTRLDDETLRKIATATSGTYINYSGENSVANEIVHFVNGLEKSEIETLLKARYRERFAFFLLPAILCLLGALMLGERRRSPRKKAAAVALLALLVFAASGCDHAFESTLNAVDRGNRLIEQERFEEALEAYQQAESQIPARPELHFDLGRAHLGLGQYDRAREAFARALESSDPRLQFDAHNNLGLALAQMERWREAYEAFQQALTLAHRHPAQIDDARADEARWNLEVAFRKMYPPCHSLEDPHEENDDPGAAATLEEQSAKDLTMCGNEEDWFTIPAIPGTRVSVRATFRDLREHPDPELPFIRQSPDVQIALFDASGEEVLVVDQGIEGEDVSQIATTRRLTRSIDKFLVTPEMVSPEQPAVLLKIAAAEALEYHYDLEIVSIPPCHALEEDLEDNDGPEQASTVEPGNHKMHSCPGDEDWFAVDLELGDTLFVDLRTQPDMEREVPPALELEIVEQASGEVVANGTPEAGLITAGIRDVTRPGRYLVHAFGRDTDQQGPYDLDVYRFAPCIVGDDRYEENDEPASASPLDPKLPMHRYLRVCDGDSDFFALPLGEEKDQKKVKLGLAMVSTPESETDPTVQPRLEFDLMSPSGDQILATGVAPDAPSEPAEDALPLAQVLVAEELEGEQALVRVTGEPTFYHLVQLDPQSQQDDQSQQDQEQEQQQSGEQPQQPDESQQQDSQQQDEGQQQSGDEQEETAGEDKSGAPDEKREDAQGAEQPKPADEGDLQKEGEERSESVPRPAEAENPEMERIEDLLEALEQTDNNFQMRKALEKMPGRYIEKDW